MAFVVTDGRNRICSCKGRAPSADSRQHGVVVRCSWRKSLRANVTCVDGEIVESMQGTMCV